MERSIRFRMDSDRCDATTLPPIGPIRLRSPYYRMKQREERLRRCVHLRPCIFLGRRYDVLAFLAPPGLHAVILD